MALPMPTGARATGGLLFMVAGWLLANAYVPNMPYERTVGLFRELTGLIGFFCGWIVMGTSVGRSYQAAAGSGLKTMLVLSFWALLAFSTWEMLLISLTKRYDTPIEAVTDIFAIMLDRSMVLLSVDCLLVFFIAGSIAGMLTETAARRWP